MSPIEEFLSHLDHIDVKLWVEGEKLRYNAPETALTPELLGQLKERKTELLEFLKKQSESQPSVRQIPRVSRDKNLPLSFAQQRLWFLHQLEPDNPFYNLSWGLHLSGTLDESALEQSFNEIVRRHEALRTTFTKQDDGTPIQIFSPSRTVPLKTVELEHLVEGDQPAEVQRRSVEDAGHPFNLETGPLLRLTLLRFSQEKHVLLVTIHHIVSDGWSMGVFVRELTALYAAFTQGRPSPLPELPIQYADFACWQRKWLSGDVWEKQISYWKKQLADAPPVLELPSDRQRPSKMSFRGAAEYFEIGPELTGQLKALSQQSRSTLFMTLLAGFATLLFRYSGQKDILIGSPLANRNRKEIEPLIGFFVNTLIMRTDFSGSPTFSELLEQVRQNALEAYHHQDMPFEHLVDALQLERSLSHAPLFQVMFVLQNASTEKLDLPNITAQISEAEVVSSQFDLILSMEEHESGLRGTLQYSTDLFDKSTIQRMAGHFRELLRGIAEDSEQPISQLPLLTQAEQHQLLVEFNDTAADYPKDKTIVDLFEEQVAMTPDNMALVFEDRELTYRELNEQANKVAHFLRDTYQIQPEERVGVLLDRSEWLVIGLLGILKAGGAYVPVDPTYPSERIRYMIEDSACRLVLTDRKGSGELSSLSSGVPLEDIRTIHHASDDSPVSSAIAHHLAYVIYTSGSTGRPKGVQIEHHSVLNLVSWHTKTFTIHQDSRATLYAGIGFDASVWETWPYLLNGACLFPLKEELRTDLEELSYFFEKHRITHSFLPSPVCEAFPPSQKTDREGLTLLTGGDVLKAIPEGVKVINNYGPTESTVVATSCPVPFPLSGSIPIGKPVRNTEIFILDREFRLVPIGVTGEICISGVGLARGYLGKPELTREKFIPHPFRDGERLYRTGDLGNWLPDGNIQFTGRDDEQVKIRGYRIELGEIQNQLLDYDIVKEAVVIVRDFRKKDKELIAYVVSPNDLDSTLLRKHLKKTLPDYMIPTHFVQMETLPLTNHGKVDKKALPNPADAGMDMRAEYAPPRDEVEKKVTAIWQDVLGLEKIGIRDNFFEIGGYSLKTTQIVTKLREEMGVGVALREIFNHPTIEAIAESIRSAMPLTQEIANRRTPLIPIQPQGKKMPLFFMHTGIGDVSCYSELSHQLGADWPFYGLQSLSFNDSENGATRKSIEEMAAEYIEAIQKIHPEGPYVFGGYSFGGVAAYEMAQQLQQRGEEVPFIIFIDVFAVNYISPIKRIFAELKNYLYSLALRLSPKLAEHRFFKKSGDMWWNFINAFDFDHIVDPALASAYFKIRGIAPNQGLEGMKKDIQSLAPEKRMKLFWETAREAGILPADVSSYEQYQLMELQNNLGDAFFDYQVRPYSGRIVSFRSGNDPLVRGMNHSDMLLDWRKFATVETFDIHEADHLTIIQLPHVKILAGKMRTYLEEAMKK